MNVRERHLVGGGIVLVMAILSVVAFPRVPTEMVTHWGQSGPDGTASRTTTLVGLPALAAGMILFFEVLPRIDPLGEHLRDLGRYYDALVVATVGLLAYVQALVVLWNLGYQFRMIQAVVPAVAVMYYVAGVVLGQVDRNWFLGVRTPWTLSSDEVWTRTHDLASPLFKLSAVVALGALVVPDYATYLVVGPVAATALVLTVYSYVAYRRATVDGNA